MRNALIGYSGFVGSSLLRQTTFDAQYRSTDIASIRGERFDTCVCAGAPSKKWLANREPAEDLRQITLLIDHLRHVQCTRFILVSTVDVFSNPRDVDESSAVNEHGLQPYGLHRRYLEQFVLEHFSRALVVRLPGLVGPGLRKNVVYDFAHDNNLDVIDSRGRFQFYPMVNLWPDIETASRAELPLVHLTAAPVSVRDVARQGFNREFTRELPSSPAVYDIRTKYADLYGASGAYQYSTKESLFAIRHFAQSEPRAESHLQIAP